jgi:hypothetical protein
MHADDVNKYEGPPCEQCRTRMFIGTCTHRPRKQPVLPPEIPFTKEEIEKLRASPYKGPN